MRVIFCDDNDDGMLEGDEVRSQHNYYSFGMEQNGIWHQDAVEDIREFRYNSIDQLNVMALGTSFYDYRVYDPAIARWLSPDANSSLNHNLPLSPFCFVANNPILYIDPDGLDWYRNNSTGGYIWLKGSEAIDGYTNVGEFAILEGDGGFILHHQNEVVGYVKKSDGGDREVAETAMFGYRTSENRDIPQFSYRDAEAIYEMPELISDVIQVFEPGPRHRSRQFKAKPKPIPLRVDASGGQVVLRPNANSVIVKKGNRYYHIQHDRVKEYVRDQDLVRGISGPQQPENWIYFMGDNNIYISSCRKRQMSLILS